MTADEDPKKWPLFTLTDADLHFAMKNLQSLWRLAALNTEVYTEHDSVRSEVEQVLN